MTYFVLTSAVLTALWINITDSFQLYPSCNPMHRHHQLAQITSPSFQIMSHSTIHSSRESSTSKSVSPIIENDQETLSSSVQDPDKRKALEKILSVGNTLTTTTVLSSILWSKQPQPASAETSTESSSSLLDRMASKFRRVPAFALVDGETGVPFMILKNTGVATGYFFTTYDGAKQVLDGAKKDAEGQDLASKDMWSGARISAVSLEFALKLGKSRPKAMAQNGVKYGTVYDIISNAADLNDASLIDRSGVYTEQGRVPLFYMKGFETGPGEGGKENRTPVFFNKQDLLSQYTKKFPNDTNVPPPPVQVFDLVDAFDTMMNPEFVGAGNSSTNRAPANILVIPSQEIRKKAVEVETARGKASAYKLGEMLAVGGK